MLNNAKWVRCGEEEAPIIRKSFFAENFKKAEIDICGLGFFELYINGTKVSDDLFVPARSDYEKRPTDTFDVEFRTYFMSYDITKFIRNGENAIGVMLGNGWYNEYEFIPHRTTKYDLPKLCFSIKITGSDGEETEIISDETLKYKPGYITHNNIFYGETHDLRLFDETWKNPGFDDEKWEKVQVIPQTDTLLVRQNAPADKKIRTIKPILVSEKENTAIYDAGENISGWLKVMVSGQEGEEVIVRYAEELNADGTLNFSTAGWPGQVQQEKFISGGKETSCEPVFTFHGFRYCEVTGSAKPLEFVVVHSDVSVKAQFTCDNEVINWFFDAYKRSQLTNMHWSTPCDCPHRERLGYTGDGQLTCDSAMLLLDAKEFYRKWIYDIYSCQNIKTGRVQYTAPGYIGGGGGPGGWGGAIVIVPYFFRKHYGETGVLKDGYAKMCKWVEYMKNHSTDGLVTSDDKGTCLGDWSVPAKEILIPPPLVNTYFFIKGLRYMKEMADEIGETFIYDELIDSGIEAIKNAYYNKGTNSFAESKQGADVFAIDLGIGNKDLIEKTARHYDETKCFDTGIFGTHILIKVLFENGYEDVAFELLSSEKKNSFGYMKNNNATTLWELWDGDDYSRSYNSHNHPMFGACAAQLFYGLLGLKLMEKQLVIEPKIPKKMEYAEGKIHTVRGEFSLCYRRKGNKLLADIDISSTEEVHFKFGDKEILLKNGKNIIEI